MEGWREGAANTWAWAWSIIRTYMLLYDKYKRAQPSYSNLNFCGKRRDRPTTHRMERYTCWTLGPLLMLLLVLQIQSSSEYNRHTCKLPYPSHR